MTVVATLAERILEAIRFTPLDHDVLARKLGVPQRQSVNQTARRSEAQGLVRRYVGRDGKIVNAPVGPASPTSAPAASPPRPPLPPARTPGQPISEDEVKEAVRDHLARQGFDVQVAWGRVRGIDIEARHPDGRRLVIEAKAETG